MSLIRAASFALLWTACATTESVQRDWDAFLLDHQHCEEAAECAVVYPGCPLGCFTAVRADAVDEAEALATELIDRYERLGRSCSYSCAEHTEPACVQGSCYVDDAPGAR